MDNLVFPDNICRLCLWSIGPLVAIFSATGEKLGISTKMNAVLPFTVSRNDPFTQSICKDCIYKVEKFYEFSRGCVRANEELKHYLVENKHPVIYVQGEHEEVTVNLEPMEDPIGFECEKEQFTFNSSDMENTCENISPAALIIDDSTNQDIETGSLCGISLCENIDECLDTSENEESSPCNVAVTPSGNAESSSNTKGDKQQETPMVPLPDEEPIHHCSKCSLKFPIRAHLNLHYCNKSLSQPLRCRFCNRTFSDMKKLAVHKKVHLITLSHSCKICLKGFPTTRALKAHLNSECPTIQDIVHNDHMYSVKSVPDNNATIQSPQFTCDTCEKSYTTPAALGKHNKSKNHMQNILTLRRASKNSISRIDGKSSGHEEIPKQVSCIKEKVNDCDSYSKQMDEKTNYSEENSKQMNSEFGGKPKRMRHSPYSESSWDLGQFKRKCVSKYTKPV